MGVKCRCPKCNNIYLDTEVVWVDPPDFNGIATPTERFVFADKNGKFWQGNTPPMKSKGDKAPSCPHCGRIKIHGLITV